LSKVIESESKKISIADERIKEIEQEMKEIKQRIDELYEQQKKALSQEKPGGEAISMLLYSNEIQKNLQYYNELGRNVSDIKLEREDRRLTVENNKETRKQIDKDIDQIVIAKDTIHADMKNINTRIAGIKNDIEKIKNNIAGVRIQKEKKKYEIDTLESNVALLEGQKARASYAQLVKEPQLVQMGKNPLMLNVIIVGVISITMFTFLAILWITSSGTKKHLFHLEHIPFFILLWF
jgi:chromosome segregation ATPase